ncbi:MAG TPA: 30S ribosomal protein S17e [Candidatus Acidoferrum sp.]|nr:30S ribosomal protein S17e [Candidatus Acidoferrum sp.]
MGNVRTDQIKRTAKELMKRFPEKFTNNFDNNKHMVSTLAQGTTIKVRNQIAGYITRTLAGMEIEKELPEEEALQEEGAEA